MDQYRFVVADENVFMRKWLARGLSPTGAELVEAGSGVELWNVLAAKEIDLLVIDGDLLNQSGLGALMAERGGLRVPFVLITAFESEDVGPVVDQVGAHVLYKPFTAAQLRRCVDDLFHCRPRRD